MNNGYKIIKFDPLKASDELWNAYFDQAEEIYREMEPGETLLARARKKALIISSCSNPYHSTYIYLLMAGEGSGRAAASFSLMVETPQSPTYKTNKHIGRLFNEFSVSPGYRSKGLAKLLLRHVLAELAANEPGVTELMVPASLDSGRRFVEKLGGKLLLEHAESRLYFKDVDWTMVERWDAEGVNRNPGVALLTVATIPEADIMEYSRAYTETINQQPLGGLKLRMEITPEQIRYYEATNLEQGFSHISIYSRDGNEVSGLTETHYLPDAPHKAQQMLTGVREKYRGLGLGKLLKARMLLHIRKVRRDRWIEAVLE